LIATQARQAPVNYIDETPWCRYPRAYARGTWELKPEIQL
jgi:hypothetical protein